MLPIFVQAVEELFNLMQLFVAQRPDMREEELEDVKQFKKTTISCYLRCLDGRSCWTTLIRYSHIHLSISFPQKQTWDSWFSLCGLNVKLSHSVPSVYCWRTMRTGYWWFLTED